MPALTFLFYVAVWLSSAYAQDDIALDTQFEQGVTAYKSGEHEQSKTILLPLANAGHAKAMNVIGLLHHNTSVFPNDPVMECDWYERSAQAGYASGMHNLAICFLNGQGRSRDPKATSQWFKMAAENGSIESMIALGGLDETSNEDRRYWLKKASNQGSRVAAATLWLDGYREDAPNFSLLDEACILLRIRLFRQSITACDD